MTDRLEQFNRKNIRVLDSREIVHGGKGNTIKMRLIKELEVSTPEELERMLSLPLSRAMAEDFLSNDPTSVGIPTGRGGLEPGENVLEFIDRTSPFNVDALPETTRTILVGIVPLPNGPLLSAASAGGGGGAGATSINGGGGSGPGPGETLEDFFQRTLPENVLFQVVSSVPRNILSRVLREETL